MKKDVLTRILAVLAALAVWQLAAMSVGSRILLATPWQALGRLLALLPTAGLWRTVGCSFVRAVGRCGPPIGRRMPFFGRGKPHGGIPHTGGLRLWGGVFQLLNLWYCLLPQSRTII